MALNELELVKLLGGITETLQANTNHVMALNFIVSAYVKTCPREQQQQVLEMLKQVSEAGLPDQAAPALQSAIEHFSSLTVSNSPEDLRRLFRVISGGKSDT